MKMIHSVYNKFDQYSDIVVVETEKEFIINNSYSQI